MSFSKELLLPSGSRRRALARRVYTELAALKGRGISTIDFLSTLPPEALAELEDYAQAELFQPAAARLPRDGARLSATWRSS